MAETCMMFNCEHPAVRDDYYCPGHLARDAAMRRANRAAAEQLIAERDHDRQYGRDYLAC